MYYCNQCPYLIAYYDTREYGLRQMTEVQGREYIRRYIESRATNPTTDAFKKNILGTDKQVLYRLAAYCDLLIRNFIHTIGPNAPGIPFAKGAKQIILSSIK